jgi:hypothetical protein
LGNFSIADIVEQGARHQMQDLVVGELHLYGDERGESDGDV